MLTDRSVVLPMTRATRAYPHLRADRDPVGEDIPRRCARWRDDHQSELREADPDVGARINRLADIWRPLFAIADAAGGEWPEKARAAADALAAVAGPSTARKRSGRCCSPTCGRCSRRRATRSASSPMISTRRCAPCPNGLGVHAEDRQGNHGASTRADAGGLWRESGNAPVRRSDARERLQARGVRGCMERIPSRRGWRSNRDTVPTLRNKHFRRSSNRDNGAGVSRFAKRGNPCK